MSHSAVAAIGSGTQTWLSHGNCYYDNANETYKCSELQNQSFNIHSVSQTDTDQLSYNNNNMTSFYPHLLDVEASRDELHVKCMPAVATHTDNTLYHSVSGVASLKTKVAKSEMTVVQYDTVEIEEMSVFGSCDEQYSYPNICVAEVTEMELCSPNVVNTHKALCSVETRISTAVSVNESVSLFSSVLSVVPDIEVAQVEYQSSCDFDEQPAIITHSVSYISRSVKPVSVRSCDTPSQCTHTGSDTSTRWSDRIQSAWKLWDPGGIVLSLLTKGYI